VLRRPHLGIAFIECPPYPGQQQVWPAMFDVGGGWRVEMHPVRVNAGIQRVLLLRARATLEVT
jgi:hypothetical protein